MIIQFDAYFPILGLAATSLVCSAILLATWCALPRWRSTQNFISVHQIATGSLHLCASFSDVIFTIYCQTWTTIFTVRQRLEDCLFALSLCWTLCSVLHAYARLVLVLPGTEDAADRRRALLFSYGTLAAIQCATNGVGLFLSNEVLSPYLLYYTTMMLTYAILMTVNLMLYACIARALLSCSGAVQSARGRRLAGIVGVAVVTDVLAVVFYFPSNIIFSFFVSVVTGHITITYMLSMYTQFMFAARLVVQTAAVLLNVRSRQEFARYFHTRRNRRLNRMI